MTTAENEPTGAPAEEPTGPTGSASNPAQGLSPRPPFYVSRRRFEELVGEAMGEIPDALWNFIENVVVTVEEWPTRRQIESTGTPLGNTLLGLYEGVPLTVRTSHYGLVPPDKITIFRGPILRYCPPDEDAIRSQVRQTVLHEIAHHFGISDQRLLELGAY